MSEQAVNETAGRSGRASATVGLGESRYDLVEPGRMTWPELRTLKRLSRMAAVEAENALKVGDPDAWFGVLYVSIQRVAPQITVEELEKRLDGETIIAIMGSVERNAPEVAAPLPPDLPSPLEEPGSPSSETSGAETPPRSTLEVSGHRA